MIKDLQLMKDISPLFEKKLVIWGVGKKGREYLEDILSMGGGREGIWLCDSDSSLWGKEILDHTILSPQELRERTQSVAESDMAILITVVSLTAQDEIISDIEKIFGKSVEIFTEYAIEWGIYLGLNHPKVENSFKDRKRIELEKIRLQNIKYVQDNQKEYLRYFAFLPLHNDEIILVYQMGKVGSKTLCESIANYGRNVLHCHSLKEVEGNNEGNICQLINMKSGKIISLVRDPVAKRLSGMWFSINQVQRYSPEVDFAEIERYYFPDQFDGGEFQWFDKSMKEVFKIDVFEYPFDQEKGYGMIRKGNIELLLLKMEKLNELEDVIGDFLNIDQFKLENRNVGSEKSYRFAYDDYKKNFKLPKEILENIYIKNEHMKHFYSEQERIALYEKWQKTE